MQIYNIQKLSIFTAILVTVSALFLGSLQLTLPLDYSDFISGNVAWSAQTKFQDLVVMPITLVGGFLIFVFLMHLFRKSNEIDSEAAQNVAFHLVLWSLPAFSTLSSLILEKKLNVTFLFISLIALIIISFSSWLFLKRKAPIEIEKISIGLLMVFFLCLAPLALSKVINIAPFSITGGGVDIADIKDWIISFFVFGFIYYIYLIFFNYKFYCRNLSKFILINQLGLALLFFTIYPARLMEGGSFLSSYDTSLSLKLLIIFIVMASLGDVIFRYLKYGKSEFTYKLISPLIIIALLVALKYGNTHAPVISSDDYHFGEGLLGWWTYVNGYIPYVDFMPSHGLIDNYFTGLLNNIFYDGSAASFNEAGRLAFTLFSSIVFLSIYKFTKSLLVSFLAIYFAGFRLGMLFLIPFATLWFHRSLLQKKVRWSIVWFITAPLLILGLPGQGLLFVASSGIIPIYFLWITFKNKDYSVFKPVIFWLLVILIFYAITPLGEMLWAGVSYVLVNGSINQLAYGVSWPRESFIFELVKMSWVLVPAAMLFTMYFLSFHKLFSPYYVLPLISVFIFALLLIPYAMGRIDPGSFSRSGLVGILLITGLMPLVLWHILGRLNRIWLIVGVVFLGSLIVYVPVTLSSLVNPATAYINVPILKNPGSDHLLSNMGRSIVNGDHWQRLNKLAEVLNKNLEPKESYLDLTSRNAQYFYLDRMPPIKITAPYNMPSSSQQNNVIESLEGNLPRLSLLAGNNIIHDGGGLALRNHYLYRFVIENYVPFEMDEFIIGLSKESIKRGDWGSLTLPDQDLRMKLFEKAFSTKNMNFRKLPIAWGKSSDSLSEKMEKVLEKNDFKVVGKNDIQVKDENTYKVLGNDPFVAYNLSQYKLSGQSVGILKFDFRCTSEGKKSKIQVFWWGDKQKGAFEENSIFFEVRNGTNIIPLDAAPRWYLLDEIKGLRIDFHNSNACQSFSIKNLSLNARTLGAENGN